MAHQAPSSIKQSVENPAPLIFEFFDRYFFFSFFEFRNLQSAISRYWHWSESDNQFAEDRAEKESRVGDWCAYLLFSWY